MVTAVVASGAEAQAKGGSSGNEMLLHDVGSRVLCRASFDGEMHLATIVERRGGASFATGSGPSSSSAASAARAFKVPLAYYVHYAHCDKRLDEWVAPGRIAPLPAGGGAGGGGTAAALPAGAAAKHANGGKGGSNGSNGAGPSHGGGGGASAAAASNGAGPSNGAAAAAAAAGTTGAAAGADPSAAAALPGSSAAAAAAALAQQKKMTRRLKRVYDQTHHVSPALDELPPLDAAAERAHQEKTRLKNIQSVELGRYEVDAWYFSPYPDPFCSLPKLHICEFCLKYFAKRSTLVRHAAKCDARHPPGDEIYRSPPPSAAGRGDAPPSAVADPLVAVFEVDGKKDKVYCQSLCLLSKLFLDHKTLYYDVDPFLFYVLCEKDSKGYHIVGYFSKEKHSEEGYNLACILTLPPYQRKGYGRFLIAFSYELSKKEGKVGTPERPLSDLGAVSYRSYWTRVILDALHAHRGNLSIRDISDLTAVRSDDVIKTLESLGLIKYWKGDHIISVTPRVIEEHLRLAAASDSGGSSGSGGRRALGVDASRLHWTPFVALGSKK